MVKWFWNVSLQGAANIGVIVTGDDVCSTMHRVRQQGDLPEPATQGERVGDSRHPVEVDPALRSPAPAHLEYGHPDVVVVVGLEIRARVRKL